MQYLDAISKMTEWSLFISKASYSINVTVIQLYALTNNAEEAEVEWSYEDPQDLLELTPQNCSFHYRVLECNSRKSKNTWINTQIWPWSTEWSKAKANMVLPRELTGHSKHPLPTIQENSMHWHHHIVNIEIRLIIFFEAKDGESLNSWQKQDQELTVAQIMNSLLPNSDLNWRKLGKPLDPSGMT